ncbi:MAG: hypothetical protein ACREOO_00100 [bacterium]
MISNFAHAQTGRLALTLKAGVIRNLQDDWHRDQPKYAIYPELQLSTELITWAHDSLALFGALYASHWDDGVERPSSRCVNCLTRSFEGRILGARLGFVLKKVSWLTLGFWGGLARHVNHGDYVGGQSIDEEPVNIKQTDRSSEIGMFVFKKLHRHLGVMIEFQQYFIFDRRTSFVLPNQQRAFKLGLSYFL